MNKEKVKKIAKYSGVLWIRSRWNRWRDNVTCDRFECSIGDILLQRNVPSQNQLLLTSRLLDVEVYLSGDNKLFPYQNAISRKAYGEKHRENDGNNSFKKLIESYQKDGYHSDSYITCDKDMNLMDGNHRMGLHIYEKIDKVNVRRVQRVIPFEYGGDWFYQAGLPTDFMETLYHKFNEIQEWLIETGNTFCVWFNNNKSEEVELVADLGHLCNVLRIIELGKNGCLAQFSMPNPQYQVKNNQLISKRAIQIEKILKKRLSNNGEIIVSKNCLEGKVLYQKTKE